MTCQSRFKAFPVVVHSELPTELRNFSFEQTAPPPAGKTGRVEQWLRCYLWLQKLNWQPHHALAAFLATDYLKYFSNVENLAQVFAFWGKAVAPSARQLLKSSKPNVVELGLRILALVSSPSSFLELIEPYYRRPPYRRLLRPIVLAKMRELSLQKTPTPQTTFWLLHYCKLSRDGVSYEDYWHDLLDYQLLNFNILPLIDGEQVKIIRKAYNSGCTEVIDLIAQLPEKPYSEIISLIKQPITRSHRDYEVNWELDNYADHQLSCLVQYLQNPAVKLTADEQKDLAKIILEDGRGWVGEQNLFAQLSPIVTTAVFQELLAAEKIRFAPVFFQLWEEYLTTADFETQAFPALLQQIAQQCEDRRVSFSWQQALTKFWLRQNQPAFATQAWQVGLEKQQPFFQNPPLGELTYNQFVNGQPTVHKIYRKRGNLNFIFNPTEATYPTAIKKNNQVAFDTWTFSNDAGRRLEQVVFFWQLGQQTTDQTLLKKIWQQESQFLTKTNHNQPQSLSNLFTTQKINQNPQFFNFFLQEFVTENPTWSAAEQTARRIVLYSFINQIEEELDYQAEKWRTENLSDAQIQMLTKSILELKMPIPHKEEVLFRLNKGICDKGLIKLAELVLNSNLWTGANRVKARAAEYLFSLKKQEVDINEVS